MKIPKTKEQKEQQDPKQLHSGDDIEQKFSEIRVDDRLTIDDGMID